MSVDRSLRNTLAAVLLVAALFVAMNRAVESAPFGEWWLAIVLAVIGVALLLNLDFSRRSRESDDPAALAVSGVQSFSPAPTPPPAPRLHTMTIRPDPELSAFDVAVSESAPAAEVIPFMDAPAQSGETADVAPTPIAVDMTPTPVSPETPAPEAEPEPAAEPVPMSPETPAPAAPEEPAVESPETPAPEVPTEVVESGPSQQLPTNLVPDISQPAPDLKYSARTEYANPDEAVASKEAPAAPPPSESVTSPQHTEPEKEVVAEKTAAPQQGYEAAQVGTITPEQADQVMSDSPDAVKPVVNEAASAAVTAQEVSGEGVVGSADDLTRLSGIGAKSAAALAAAGIDSFPKLANSSDDDIRVALTTAGVRLVGDVDTWAQQAAYAARGDWDGLKQFNAGRKTPNGD